MEYSTIAYILKTSGFKVTAGKNNCELSIGDISELLRIIYISTEIDELINLIDEMKEIHPHIKEDI